MGRAAKGETGRARSRRVGKGGLCAAHRLRSALAPADHEANRHRLSQRSAVCSVANGCAWRVVLNDWVNEANWAAIVGRGTSCFSFCPGATASPGPCG